MSVSPLNGPDKTEDDGMPVQESTSAILMRLGGEQARKAFDQHKNDATNYGILTLPPGIVGGVAELKKVVIGTYGEETKHPGKPYVMFQGYIKFPTEFHGIELVGKPISKQFPFCATPNAAFKAKTFDQNFADLLNEIRKFLPDLKMGDAKYNFAHVGLWLDSMTAAANAGKPIHFGFNTREFTPKKIKPSDPDPTPITIINFEGAVSFDESKMMSVVQAAQTDATSAIGTDAEKNGETAASRQVVDDKVPNEPVNQTRMVPSDQTQTSGEFTDEEDLNSLLARANSKDAEAQNKLEGFAVRAGYTVEEVKNTAEWEDVIDMINNPRETQTSDSSGQENVPDEDEPGSNAGWIPQVGSIVMHAPLNKNGDPYLDDKGQPKRIQAKVTDIDWDNGTCTVSRLDTKPPRENKGVKVDSLLPVELP